MSSQNQSLLFRGIYEFEDPAGTFLAAKIPQTGTADLYDGTAVIVKPNQRAILIYKGKIADILPAGTHIVKSENLPIVTRLANWQFGFKSPLRCEIWFFTSSAFLSRRWGTAHPVIAVLDPVGPVPIRGYGNYNVEIRDPEKLYQKLIGSRSTYDIVDLEEFIQGQIVEFLPEALKLVKRFEELSESQDKVSHKLESLVNSVLFPYGVKITRLQVLSLLPPKEVIEAVDARAAMKIIGNQKEYLLYKAANSLDVARDHGSNDSMQMMLGLMLGKGIMGLDYHDKENAKQDDPKAGKNPGTLPEKIGQACPKCATVAAKDSLFCANCGTKL